MLDPERNIHIAIDESESALREKADIHRARLNRFGRSKMNDVMLFLGPNGTVYTYSSNGKKIYITLIYNSTL